MASRGPLAGWGEGVEARAPPGVATPAPGAPVKAPRIYVPRAGVSPTCAPTVHQAQAGHLAKTFACSVRYTAWLLQQRYSTANMDIMTTGTGNPSSERMT